MEQIAQLNNDLMSSQQKQGSNDLQVEGLTNKLAELTKEMNQFTNIVSHDLQAPLRMVTGFLELLEKKHSENLNECAKQYIDYAVKGANKMKSLIYDLLEYSRVSSVVNESVEVDLNQILQEVKEKLLPVIKETGAIITNNSLPVIKADRKKMVLLFEHLLGNSLKFRSLAEPEITIAAKEENGFWVIAVNDNGIGIDPAFADKIFIIFRRLHNDDTKYAGTGIGLAICKKIAELHGGSIWLESAVGKGSSFFFTLPYTFYK